MLVVAAVFGLVALLTWFAFLRPVPVLQTLGVVKSIEHKPAGTFRQEQVGAQRGFRIAVDIPTEECYVLELYSKQLDVTGYISIALTDKDKYQKGQEVVMNYQLRGLPGIGYKTMVLSIETK